MAEAQQSQVIRELAEANSLLAQDLAQCTTRVDEASYCCGVLGYYLAMHRRFLEALFGQQQESVSPSSFPAGQEIHGKAQTAEELQAILEHCQNEQWALAQIYKKVLSSEMEPETRDLVERQFQELQQAIAGFEYNFSIFRPTH